MTLILLILLLVVGQGQADNPLSLLESSGVKGGVVVHLGCGDGQATVSLRAADSHVVRGLDNDAEDVEKARRHVRSLGKFGKPMIYIANYWSDPSYTTAKVYSNAEEVELFLNGESLGRTTPDTGRISTELRHPPFTYNIETFKPGTLRAVGYIDGEQVVETQRVTPGSPSQLELIVDKSGKPLEAGQKDVVFVYASITDENGTTVYSDSSSVEFSLKGDGKLIGQNPIRAGAGIATILLRAGATPREITVRARAEGLERVEKRILVR